MTDKCSCGARDKTKCSKESGLGSGKMCLKAQDDQHFNWEEQDWSENKLFYENDLEHLEELPRKEKI